MHLAPALASRTFRKLGAARLTTLCDTAGFDVDAALRAWDVLVDPWGDRPVGATRRRDSDITDDHSPFEFSLSVEANRIEPRFLVESQGATGSLTDAWQAARATNERLRAAYGVSLARLGLVEDLFAPRVADVPFAMWHAAWLRHDAAPLFKVYLSPQAGGAAEAPARTQEAFRRLGLGDAWPSVERLLARRGGRDRLIYFSLDLSDDARARVKLYIAHPGITARELDALLAGTPGTRAGDVTALCRALTGQTGSFTARPLLTTLAFTAGDTRPSAVTLHVPIRCYVRDDGVALDNIARHLGAGPGALYRQAIERFADRDLRAGVGMQTYVSVQRRGEALRTTVYLAPELYAVAPPLQPTQRSAAPAAAAWSLTG